MNKDIQYTFSNMRIEKYFFSVLLTIVMIPLCFVKTDSPFSFIRIITCTPYFLFSCAGLHLAYYSFKKRFEEREEDTFIGILIGSAFFVLGLMIILMSIIVNTPKPFVSNSILAVGWLLFLFIKMDPFDEEV